MFYSFKAMSSVGSAGEDGNVGWVDYYQTPTALFYPSIHECLEGF